MEKNLFISHSSLDKEVVEVLAKLIERVSLNQIHIWFSNDKGSDGGFLAGDNWYETIIEHLNNSQGTIVFITPNSNNQPWILYESGYAESLHNNTMIPLKFCVSINEVATPLSHKQIFSFSSIEEANIFIAKVLKIFDIIYDKEAFCDIVEDSLTQMRKKLKIGELKNNCQLKPKADNEASINKLEKKIDHYFNMVWKNIQVQENHEIGVEFTNSEGEVMMDFLKVGNETLVSDILDQVYYLIEDRVSPFRYLETWILKKKNEERYVVISDFQNVIPAKDVFVPYSEWKVVFLDEPYKPNNSYNRMNNVVRF